MFQLERHLRCACFLTGADIGKNRKGSERRTNLIGIHFIIKMNVSLIKWKENWFHLFFYNIETIRMKRRNPIQQSEEVRRKTAQQIVHLSAKTAMKTLLWGCLIVRCCCDLWCSSGAVFWLLRCLLLHIIFILNCVQYKCITRNAFSSLIHNTYRQYFWRWHCKFSMQ